MGVVYAAEDERLGRPVAVKVLHPQTRDSAAPERLWREARAAARVNHPHICQVYEIAEEAGRPYIVMELLEGESLAARLASGALSIADSSAIALEILNALEALHRAGFVHRDLKPSNVFLTSHGVKLLDFGLARRTTLSGEAQTLASVDLTETGAVLGTPRYMSPEQARGNPIDPRSDIFAAGSILFEMLAGRPAFEGKTAVEVMLAVLNEQPPALAGSAAVAALDRVARRALAKAPADRYPSAAAMAEALRAALLVEETTSGAAAPRALAMTRLVALPFRALRPDPETDFLSFGLADAISSSLSGLSTLIVRSSLAAAAWADKPLDLRAIAAEMEVDSVLTGTLLRAGDRLRVTAQLVEAPGGSILWTETSDVALDDVFRLQDGIARKIVESVAAPLTSRERRLLSKDVPATARAYELYLRANQVANDVSSYTVARDLYRECLRDDPNYAPAWARLGRVLRVMAKFYPEGSVENLAEAERAFERALELNPELTLAQHLYANFEVEAGRTTDALRRLLSRATSGSADPELFAGLVHVLRYAGLVDASMAAHEQARRLDPTVRTSVAYSYLFAGEYEKAVGNDREAHPFVRDYALALLGRREEAIAGYKTLESQTSGVFRLISGSQRAALEGNREEAIGLLEEMAPSGFRDPEGRYFVARTYAFLGERAPAVELLGQIVDSGFFCVSVFQRDPWLDSIRTQPEFPAIVRRAEARHREAKEIFEELKGPRLLGLPG